MLIQVKVTEEDTALIAALASGRPQKLIAENMGLNFNRLAKKIIKLRYKVGCNNVAHLVAFGYENGLIKARKIDER